MTLALLFPGQGSQSVGMGRALFEASEPARRVFAEADAVLGFPLSTLCFEGPEEELRSTVNTQPAILTHSIAALRELESGSPQRLAEAAFAAGHSVGEYAAHVAAGTLAFADALRLVRARGRFMQEAVPPGVGSMAAILGLTAEQVEAACGEAAGGEIVAPANFNSPEQTVIAGHAAAVGRACEACTALGARRAIPLAVSAPFHCALMAPARARMEPLLREVAMSDARIPVVTNADARPEVAAGELRAALARQIDGPVRWVESIRRLASEGVGHVIEIGPGKVLSGLVKRIDRSIRLENYG